MGIKQSTVGVLVKTEIVGNKEVADGVEQVKRSVKSAQEETKNTSASFGKIQGQIQQAFSGNVDAAGELVKGLNDINFAAVAVGAGLGLAFGAVVKYVADVTVATQKSALELDQFKQKLNGAGSYEFLGTIRKSAQDLGISLGAVQAGLAVFVQKLQATKGSTATFESDLFKLADRFQKMPDGAQKSELAIQNFGRAGEALIPILNQGSAGMQQLMEHMRKTGQLMDDQMVAAADRAAAAQAQLNDTIEGFNTRVGGVTLPILADFVGGLNRMIDTADRGERPITTLNSAAVSLGVGIAETHAAAANASGALLTMGSSAMIAAGQVLTAANQTQLAAGEIAAAVSVAMRIGDQFDRFGFQFEKGAAKIAAQDYARAKAADAAAAAQRADIEELRAGALAENKAADAVDNANTSLDKQMGLLAGGAGGMRKMAEATKDAADAQDELKKRTQSVGGAIGISTEAMSKMDQLQTAWKLATGETTLEQLRQDAAMKSLMKAYDAGAISMSDALATLVAFRNGQIDINRVFDVAGDVAKPFKDELNKLYTDMGDGLSKVADLAAGIDKLPNAKKTELSVGVAPGTVRALDDLHERLAAIKDRTVTLTVVVAGLGQLGALFPGVGNVGTQPIGGGGTPWVDPNRGGLGNGGTTNPATSNEPPGEGKGGVTVQNNIIVDGKTVAKSVVNAGGKAARQDKKRSYTP